MDAVEAILAAYHMERIVFGRIIDMGTDVQLCKRIISFWLWLEAEGYEDIVKQLCCHDDDDQLLAHACAEAEAALSYLNSDPLQSTSPSIIPITARLSGCRSSLHNTIRSVDSVSKSISGIFNGVCSVIFKDIMEERGLQDDHNNDNDNNTWEEDHRVRTVRKWFRPRGEAMNDQRGGGAGSTLNPSAKEWYPWQSRAPDEDRSLFITFSNGYPLTHFQIWQFFTS